MRQRGAPVLVPFVLLCLNPGCSSGGGGKDAGIDAARGTDAAQLRCTDAAECAGQRHNTVCDEGRCVECKTGEQCGDEALGPSCRESDGYCVCASGDDCTANLHGPFCHPVALACGCERDRDCPEPMTCELEPYLGAGVRTCQTP